MPFVKDISLLHFRNYQQRKFDFQSNIVCICGANGSGKTNLLDALYYLCFTKSYFSKPEIKNTTYGELGFKIEANIFEKNNEHIVSCILRETGKKEFYVDNEAIKKFSKHIGKFPVVMIAPDDAVLITGSSEERRKFLDTLLSQLYPEYLQDLIDYNRVLVQRNSFLKNVQEQQNYNHDLMETFNQLVIQYGEKIFAQRKKFAETFAPLIIQQYHSIAGKHEAVEISYQSQLNNESFSNILKENKQKDLYTQRTTSGIHRDDLILLLDNEPFKQSASQGQRKSMLFALKLAEYYSLKNIKKDAPILLLDDIFEKLDQSRMLNLLQKVCDNTDTQIFITDTHKHRLEEAFNELKLAYQMIGL